jgi:hypothetical protein
MENQNLGIDYLNSIAPKEPAKSSLDWHKLALLVGGVLVVIVSLALVSSIIGAEKAKTINLDDSLNVRLTNIQRVATMQHHNLNSSELRAVNANLDTQLSTILVGLKAQVPTRVPSATVTATESAHLTGIEEALTTAKLMAVFDRTYPRQLSYELALVLSMMDEAQSRSKNAAYIDFLQESYDTIESLKDQFDEIDSLN